ncbi:hypothetical protein BD410DRAFT_721935 [Rickenella mellea]|uniref:BTB domain-containing protein n=1 Tax=Rickenella mellea TaxID=50990 RepID=A0A4Y7Q6N5_9AGAM|nr:hypothetical protein BD410DRAFT_721935 [Rickenella mellea]
MPNLLQSRSCVYRHTLEEVSCVDFDRLLTFMYPQDFMERESWTSTEWSSILAIATKLEIHTLRQVAIKRLSQVGSDVDRIVFGRLHNVKEWLGPAHLALCNRDQPLTVDEVLRLDKLTLHGIMVARESRYGHQLPGMTRKLTLDDIGKTFDDIV